MVARDKKLALIYRHTDRNYKGKLPDGTKTVLVLRAGGTQLVPLTDLTDFEVDKKFAAVAMMEVKREAKAREAKADKIVEKAYYATCSGIQIDIMDIGKVFAFGRTKIEAGEDFPALCASVRAYVETIRKN